LGIFVFHVTEFYDFFIYFCLDYLGAIKYKIWQKINGLIFENSLKKRFLDKKKLDGNSKIKHNF
jgi:hypothetical protein